jgi:hypothetical protein
MTGLIKAGTVMMQTGTLLPESSGIEPERYSPGWSTIRDSDGDVVDRNLRKAGWSFFFMAANIQAMGWGSWGEKAIRRAVKHVLARVKPLGFNCLEITELSARRFLGFPYVHVSAHSRHIQKSAGLQELAERNRDGAAVAWAVG